MTKIAILSDIHGNLDALKAVLVDAQTQGVQRLFVCGDIAGYYYDTAAVWQTLKMWDAVMCRGNHEAILADWVADVGRDDITRRYGSSYRIAAETMSQEDMGSLLSLSHPVEIIDDDVRFLLTHGAPWDEDVYLYPDMTEEHRERLSGYADRYDVVLMGHTHYPFAFEQDNFLILNSGSVGQPRSGKEILNLPDKARAQWALYDTSDQTYSLITSSYDPSRIFEQAEKYDPHLPYLKTVLKRQDEVT